MRWRISLTPEIAQPLFAAIATDTGWFRFASTGAGRFGAARGWWRRGPSPISFSRNSTRTRRCPACN